MKRILSALVSGLFACSLLSACGSPAPAPSSSPESSTPSASDTAPASASESSQEAPEASAPAERVILNIAYMPNYASLCSVVAGMRMGAFDEEGIDIKLVEFADGPTIIAAMESGSIDIGYIGPGAHKLCIQGKAKIIAMSHVGNGDAIVGRKSKGVEKAEDSKGKIVAYASGTSSEQILTYTLENVGLSMSDITPMEMDPSGIVTAMVSGSIDACATWSPSTFTIQEQLGDDAVTIADNLTFSDKSAAVSSWIAMDKYAQEHTDTLLRFTRALYKAMDYRAEHVDEVCKWVSEQLAVDYDSVYNQRGDADWITSAELVQQVKDGSIEKLYEVQQDNFLSSGQIEEKVPVSDYVMFDNMLNAAQ